MHLNGDTIHYLSDCFNKTLVLKTCVAGLLTGLLAFLNLNIEAMGAIFVLVFIDYLTGLLKGVKNKKLASRRAIKKTKWLLMYLSLVIAIGVLQRLTPVLDWVEYPVLAIIGSVELISIIENAQVLNIPGLNKLLKPLYRYLDEPKEK